MHVDKPKGREDTPLVRNRLPDFAVDSSRDAIFVTNVDGEITYVNRAFEQVYGLDGETVIGVVPHVVGQDGVRFALDQEFWAKVVTQQIVSVEIARGADTSTVVQITGSASPVLDDKGDVVGFIAVHCKDADANAFGRSYRGVFEQTPIPTWIIDAETLRFLTVNEAAITHYGYSQAEFLQTTLANICRETDLPVLKRKLAGMELGTSHIGIRKHRKKDGAELEVDVTTQLFELRGRRYLLQTARDLTEQQRLEALFLQAQKLGAVGRLAGSIAHDFNNMLSVILTYTSLAKEGISNGSEIREDLDEIERAAQRATALTRQLLTFSRRHVVAPKPLEVAPPIAALTKMLGRLLGEDIELHVNTVPDPWPVRIDKGQLDQVLMNLAINARDAMPAGGALTIATENVMLDEAEVQTIPFAKPGPHVRISVIDTGAGMSAAVKERIFEPFFTTKEEGKGTGLGLATVLGIVRQSGGSLRVESEVGLGSRIDVFLPRAEPTSHAPSIPPSRQAKGESGEHSGVETILLVEDDDQLRQLLERMLRKKGYAVLAAADADEANAQVDGHPGPLDLLLTDVVMPRMNGPKLAEVLCARRPGLRVLFMSGYACATLQQQGFFETSTPLLQKPISPNELYRCVREMLDQPEQTPT